MKANNKSQLSFAILATTCALMTAGEVVIPSFDQWEIVRVEGRAGEVQLFAPSEGYPQGRAVFSGVDGEYTIIVKTDVAIQPGVNYEATVEYAAEDLSDDDVPAFSVDSVDEAGRARNVTCGGVPHPAGGMLGTRTLPLKAELIGDGKDGKMTISFYVAKLHHGASVTLTGYYVRSVASVKDDHTPASFAGDRGGIIFNEDCTEVFCVLPKEKMTVDGLNEYIDNVLPGGHQIRIFMLNPGSVTNNYGSDCCPVMWDGVQFNADGTAVDAFGQEVPAATVEMYGKMKSLVDNGINIHKVWIEHLRERGVSPWISLRMNDSHDALTPEEFRVPLRKAPYRIAPYNSGDWHDQAQNYELPEIREYYQKILFAYMEEFDADGFELDWMRFGRLFRHGREAVGMPLLTQFMREARAKANEMAARRGHPVKLAVRVPSRVQDSIELGYDVATWAAEGLMDILIPTNFLWTTDGDTPVAEWRRLVGPDVLIAPGVEASASSYVGASFYGDELIRNGFAAAWFFRGADMIYYFNHMHFAAPYMLTPGAPETAYAAPRRHVLTFPDFPAIGRDRISKLPTTVPSAAVRSFRLPTGPAPAAGRRAWIVAGADAKDAAFDKALLNGEELRRAPNVPYLLLGGFIKNVAAWEIPDGALLDDSNVIELRAPEGKSYTLNWLEIYIEAAK